MYTAIVLDQRSQNILKSKFGHLIPMNWLVLCHHMTINLGHPEEGPLLNSGFSVGQSVPIHVVSLAQNDKVMACGVVCNVPSNNPFKHITLAINPGIGRPSHSKELTNWEPVPPIMLNGQIQEVKTS